MIIGIDLSSSKTGICFMNEDFSIYKMDYIKTTTTTKADKEKYKDIYDKIDEIVSYFKHFKQNDPNSVSIKRIIIEEPLNKFSRGKSSIKTISLLLQVNFAVSYQLYQIFGIKPEHYSFISCRSLNKIKIPKGEDAKQKVYEFVCNTYPEYKKLIPEYSKNNPLIDVADAVIIARGGLMQ